MNFDPAVLAVLSLWAGVVASIGALAALVARGGYQVRGRWRNARSRCARCAVHWEYSVDGCQTLMDGLYVCKHCATDLRRFLRVGLPAVAAAMIVLTLLSGIGFLTGSPAVWTFNGQVIPPLVISVGPLAVVGITAGLLAALTKRANRRARRAAEDRQL